MSLTGNLEIFPIEEVLRLLARSRKTGCLRVDSAGQQGRIFIAGGALTFATTNNDEDTRRQVINAGLVNNEDFRKVDLSGASLSDALAPGVSSSALTDFVREQIVESLYRTRKPGSGKFDFLVDVAARYPTGQAFDAEVSIADADRRAIDWEEIESIVPSMSSPYRLVRELPDENAVTIHPNTWRLMAAVEAGASANELADKLGLSRFRAASELASLVRLELLELAPAKVSTPMPAPAPDYAVAESPVVVEPTWEPEPAPALSGWETPEPEETVEETANPAVDESWFSTPEETVEDTAEEISAESSEEAEVPAEAPSSDERTAGWWAGAVEPSAEPVTESGDGDEADRFLESVFSQLNEPAAATEEEVGAEDDGNFGLGLLRRRRMGTAARDITGQ